MPSGKHCATPAGISDGTSCGVEDYSGNTGNFADTRDGQVYPWVKIGAQIWLAKNLNTGTRIDTFASAPCIDVSGGSGYWSCQTNVNQIEKYCYNNNDSQCTTYGGLYEWAQTMGLPYQCNYTNYTCDGSTCSSVEYPNICNYSDPANNKIKGICPAGWHIPSRGEWSNLGAYLSISGNGGSGLDSGGKIKEAGTSHWSTENCGDAVCNSSSFNVLPAGARLYNGTDFALINDFALFWSSSFSGNIGLYGVSYLMSSSVILSVGGDDKGVDAWSVRCIKN